MVQLRAHVLRANEGELASNPEGVSDRFLVLGSSTGGRFAIVQHIFAPRALAAPMHRLRTVDEYTYVLSGRIGVSIGGEELVGGPGDLVFKPHDQWHTFWNPGDEPATVLDIISPPGLEEMFREMARLSEALTPELMAAMAARYGCEVDFEATGPLVERHGLRW